MITTLRRNIKRQDSMVSKLLYRIVKFVKCGQLPPLTLLYKPIYFCYKLIGIVFHRGMNLFIYVPMLQSRLTQYANGLQLENGMPLIVGSVSISIGDNTCLNGAMSVHGHPDSEQCELVIGSNCYIGWQTGIAVGTKVIIGNNVMIAGRTSISGSCGHGVEDRDKPQMADLVIEDDVWLCTNCQIVRPVHIGRGSVIAAGCIVTKDVPENVLFGGNPGKVIRYLNT
jgi:acetyltransferase-like isoleucine patch superfamily enzyme